jgi:hypothetical protein
MLGATLGNMAVGMVAIPKDSLVFYEDWASPVSYPGSGTTVFDIGPNTLTGSLVNSPTYVQYTNGGYFDFNGTTQRINYLDNLDILTNNRTLGAWVYLNTLPVTTARYFFGKISPATGEGGRFGLAAVSTTNRFRLAWQSTTSYLLDSTAALVTGSWYMLSATIDRTAGSAVTYINASTEIKTHSIAIESNNYNTTRQLTIGAGSGGVQYFPGRVGMSFMYNRALTSTEIENIYNQTKNRYI